MILFRSIKTVKEKITLDSWNKEEAHDEGRYEQYKIKISDVENVTIKSYHILELEHLGELYGIYFPCYELDTFERITGLIAEKE